jgi:hypothetical protein
VADRTPVTDHPQKVRVDGFAADGSLRAEDGWINMNVKWLITKDSVGSQQTVFGITVFPPGAAHDVHRHPHAEETEYIVRATASPGSAMTTCWSGRGTSCSPARMSTAGS